MTAPLLLLLEDDPAIARTVAYALQREGLEVDAVQRVGDARQRLSAPGRYALALLDIGLPDGNGLDLCRALRASQPALPIVLLTARGEELDRVLGLELGADDYITKPFSPRELCARVRALLRRTAVTLARGAPALPSDFHHDPAAGRIALGGEWLLLTRIEYGLLATLLRAPGRIWSRAALLDAVWGQDALSTDRTVDTHIKTLRAKLNQQQAGSQWITTHRGSGYALAANAVPPT